MGAGAGPMPDYQGAAREQQQSSAAAIGAQTMANRPNTTGPFSTEQWTQGPDGSWQRSLGFGGGLGAGASALGNEAGAALSTPLDPSLFGPIGTGDDARRQAIDASFGQATSRLDPLFERRGRALEAKLAGQGLDPNSEAYRNAMGAFGRDQNDAYGSALNSAIGQGREAGESVFRQNLMQHQTALADALQRRNAPLAQMGQLSGLLGQPGFNTAGAADPLQSLAATGMGGDWQVKDAQMKNQFWSDLIGGIASLGTSVAGAALSDARLKENIQRLSQEAIPGVPYATWEWVGCPGKTELGVIAQDVLRVAPHLVSIGADGYLRVDNSLLEGLPYGEWTN